MGEKEGGDGDELSEKNTLVVAHHDVPEGWVKRLHPATGAYFFINHAGGILSTVDPRAGPSALAGNCKPIPSGLALRARSSAASADSGCGDVPAPRVASQAAGASSEPGQGAPAQPHSTVAPLPSQLPAPPLGVAPVVEGQQESGGPGREGEGVSNELHSHQPAKPASVGQQAGPVQVVTAGRVGIEFDVSQISEAWVPDGAGHSSLLQPTSLNLEDVSLQGGAHVLHSSRPTEDANRLYRPADQTFSINGEANAASNSASSFRAAYNGAIGAPVNSLDFSVVRAPSICGAIQVTERVPSVATVHHTGSTEIVQGACLPEWPAIEAGPALVHPVYLSTERVTITAPRNQYSPGTGNMRGSMHSNLYDSRENLYHTRQSLYSTRQSVQSWPYNTSVYASNQSAHYTAGGAPVQMSYTEQLASSIKPESGPKMLPQDRQYVQGDHQSLARFHSYAEETSLVNQEREREMDRLKRLTSEQAREVARQREVMMQLQTAHQRSQLMHQELCGRFQALMDDNEFLMSQLRDGETMKPVDPHPVGDPRSLLGRDLAQLPGQPYSSHGFIRSGVGTAHGTEQAGTRLQAASERMFLDPIRTSPSAATPYTPSLATWSNAENTAPKISQRSAMRISFDAAHLQESDQSVRGGHTPYDLSDMQAKLQSQLDHETRIAEREKAKADFLEKECQVLREMSPDSRKGTSLKSHSPNTTFSGNGRHSTSPLAPVTNTRLLLPPPRTSPQSSMPPGSTPPRKRGLGLVSAVLKA